MAEAEWRRSEPREVRPFFAAADAGQAVSGSRIQLFDGESPSGDETFDLNEEDAARLKVQVFPSLSDPQEWLPEHFQARDFSVIVVATNTFLKRSKVILATPAHLFNGQSTLVGSDVLEYLGGGRNLSVSVALCLTSDKLATVGAPFLIGHWLSSKTFNLRDKSSDSLFDVRTRNDAEWAAAGYPARTMYAVEYSTRIAAEADENVGVAVVYFHIDAFNRMAGQRLGDSLQPLLTADIVAQILEQSRGEWEGLTEAPDASPLATLLSKFKGTKLGTLPELQRAVKQPAKLRATLQQEFAVLAAVASGGA